MKKIILPILATSLIVSGCSDNTEEKKKEETKSSQNTSVTTSSSSSSSSSTTTTTQPTKKEEKTLSTSNLRKIVENPSSSKPIKNAVLTINSKEFAQLSHKEILDFFKEVELLRDKKTEKSTVIYIVDKNIALQSRTANIIDIGTLDLSTGIVTRTQEEGYMWDEAKGKYLSSYSQKELTI